MIPAFIQPYFWSYDVSQLDLKKNKKRIITNVLNLGTKKATKWLFDTYRKEEIIEVIKTPLPGEWSTKSLHFWSFVFGVKESKTKRNF